MWYLLFVWIKDYFKLIKTFEQLGNSFEISVTTLAGITAVRTAVTMTIGAIITHLNTAPDERGGKSLNLHPTVYSMHLHDFTYLWITIIQGILTKQVIHLLFLFLAQFFECKSLPVVQSNDTLSIYHSNKKEST